MNYTENEAQNFKDYLDYVHRKSSLEFKKLEQTDDPDMWCAIFNQVIKKDGKRIISDLRINIPAYHVWIKNRI